MTTDVLTTTHPYSSDMMSLSAVFRTPNFNYSQLSSSLRIARNRSPCSGLVRMSASISLVGMYFSTVNTVLYEEVTDMDVSCSLGC